jgi:hypothetical protein
MAIGGHFPEPELLRRNNAASRPSQRRNTTKASNSPTFQRSFTRGYGRQEILFVAFRGWDAAGARWFLTTLLDLRK